MRINGVKTRDRILTVAQGLILEKGYSGTSIDQIIANAAVTKGGFFYHFEGKRDLAKNLLIRFLDEDEQITNELLARAKSLTEDPLQQVLIFLKLYAELAAKLPKGHPGCLVASYIYESQQFDSEIHEIARKGMASWKASFEVLLKEAEEKHPLIIDVDLGEMSSMFTAIFEGGIILSKLSGEPKILSNQILLYRTYIRFVFGNIDRTEKINYDQSIGNMT